MSQFITIAFHPSITHFSDVPDLPVLRDRLLLDARTINKDKKNDFSQLTAYASVDTAQHASILPYCQGALSIPEKQVTLRSFMDLYPTLSYMHQIAL